MLEDRDAHEAQIAKQFYEDRTSVDPRKITQERKVKENNIDTVVKACLEVRRRIKRKKGKANRKRKEEAKEEVLFEVLTLPERV